MAGINQIKLQARRMRVLLDGAGCTAAEFAQRCGVPPMSVQAVLRCRGELRKTYAEKIAKATGTDEGWITCDRDEDRMELPRGRGIWKHSGRQSSICSACGWRNVYGANWNYCPKCGERKKIISQFLLYRSEKPVSRWNRGRLGRPVCGICGWLSDDDKKYKYCPMCGEEMRG